MKVNSCMCVHSSVDWPERVATDILDNQNLTAGQTLCQQSIQAAFPKLQLQLTEFCPAFLLMCGSA